MNKQKLIKDYPMPNMPEDIKKALKKRKAENIAFVHAETKKIGKQMVNIVTFYKKKTDVDYNNSKQINIKYEVNRYFISKNDYYQMEITSKSWNDKTLVTKCTKRYYSPFGYRSKKPKYIPYDDNTLNVLQRMNKCLHTDENLSLWEIVCLSIAKIEGRDRKIRKQKRETVINAEMNENFKPFRKISKAAFIECESHLPVYLYEEDNNCFCTSCKKDTHIDVLDKHLTMRKCPSCGKEAKVQLVKHCKALIEDHEFIMIPKIVNNNKYAIAFLLSTRYINKTNYKNFDVRTYECNRYIYDSGMEFYYEFSGNKWNKVPKSVSHFTEYVMGYNENHFYCGEGYLYSGSIKEYKSMEGFEYYRKYSRKEPINLSCKDTYMYIMEDNIIYHRGHFLEMMEKVGLINITSGMFYLSDVDYTQTSLIKMLKLNKSTFQYLLKKKTYKDLRALQDIVYEGIFFDETIYEKVNATSKYASSYDYIYLIKHKRLLNYLLKQENVNYPEYKHYLNNLRKLGYDMDKKINLYPKDFRKADMRVSKEIEAFEAEKEKRKALLNTERSKRIKLISDGLREMPNIKDYLGGSNKLLVKIPESIEDLKQEGLNLSNCIGSYGEDISDGKTFIFFIRSADKPDDSFYAMEYTNGYIKQLRGFANKEAPEDVEAFCADFCAYLRKKKFNPKNFLQAA